MLIRQFILASLVLAFFSLTFVSTATGQDTLKTMPNGTDGLVFTYRDTASNQVDKLPPNSYVGSKTTFKIGLGWIYDFTTYQQDATFKKQMDTAGFDLGPTFKTPDFRILGSGVIKSKRYLAFKFAYMYDGDAKKWLVRESGLTIGVPELFGNIFIGRTKEGFSMIKVMNGHSGITNERQMALDVIPIMADGIKWMGALPKSRIFWNLGYFNDLTSKGQGFSTFQWQYVARVGWLAFNNTKEKTLLHIAGNFQYSKPLDGKMTMNSSPESNPTPQILNTGSFATDKSTHIGGEIYYKKGSFMIGSEVVTHKFHADKSASHQFTGGDVILSYFFGGNDRPYTTTGSIFQFVPVRKSVFKGGPGEFEAVVRFSKFSLDDKEIRGGSFWRLTPMINWYLAKQIRMEFIYGYGKFDRYGMQGKVQFFESRIQFSVL